MAETKAIPKIPKLNFSLNISNISKLDTVWSPEYTVQGIPWKVQVCKKIRERNTYLAIRLFCAKKEKSENWSHSAFATFKLLSFNDRVEPVVYNGEHFVFDSSGLGYGRTEFMKWDDLLDIEKGYVKDDAMVLDVTIEAADPDDASKSEIAFENTAAGCEEGCMTEIRLSVTNITNLMAVKSPKFNMRKLPWDLTVCKSRSSMFGMRLESKLPALQKISSNVNVRIKLTSSKGDPKTVEVTTNILFKHTSEVHEFPVVPWNDLINPENGFMNNGSIGMEVKIEASKPEDVVCSDQNDEATSSQHRAKKQRMECSVCLETIGGQEVAGTKCGHLFCLKCITDSVKAHKKCPSCNTALTLKDFHPFYLSFTN